MGAYMCKKYIVIIYFCINGSIISCDVDASTFFIGWVHGVIIKKWMKKIISKKQKPLIELLLYRERKFRKLFLKRATKFYFHLLGVEPRKSIMRISKSR